MLPSSLTPLSEIGSSGLNKYSAALMAAASAAVTKMSDGRNEEPQGNSLCRHSRGTYLFIFALFFCYITVCLADMIEGLATVQRLTQTQSRGGAQRSGVTVTTGLALTFSLPG